MKDEYSYKLDNKLKSYTIYCNGKELDEKEVISLLEQLSQEEQPSYYSGNGSSPVDCFMDGLLSTEETKGFFKGNVIKYVVRCGKKENNTYDEDLIKAKFYINKLMEMFK